MNDNVKTNETVENEMTFDRAAATLEAFKDGLITDGADIREAVCYALSIMDKVKSEDAIILYPDDSAYTICEKLETAKYMNDNQNYPDRSYFRRTYNEFTLNKLGKLLIAVTMQDD